MSDFTKKTIKTSTITLVCDDAELATLDNAVWVLKDLFECCSRTVNDAEGNPTIREVTVDRRGTGEYKHFRLKESEWQMLCSLYSVI